MVDPSLVNAQVFANQVSLPPLALSLPFSLPSLSSFSPSSFYLQGMSADGSRLGDAMKDLLNAVDGLEPQDCRDIAQADQRIKNLIKEVEMIKKT